MNWLQKAAVSVLGLDQWASRHDGVNFRTNTVSLAEYEDRFGSSGVLGLSTVWACVGLLAGTISSLPLMVYRDDRRGGRQPATDHRLYRVLHNSPNADQTAVDFWEFMCASIELQGDAFSEVERNALGDVTALDEPLAPDIVKRRRMSDGSIRYEWYRRGRSYSADQTRMLHIRGFGGDALGGLSTLAHGRSTFGLAGAIERAAAATFRNGVRPSGFLKSDKNFQGTQRKEAEDLLAANFQGAVNSGRPMLLDAHLTWQQLSINPDDAQMLESRSFSVEEICRWFGVPPFMVGHTEKATSWGTGIEQQTLGFQKFTLRHRLKRIEQALEKQLLSAKDRAEGMTIEFNLEGLLRGDSKARAEVNSIYLKDKVVTINEVRAQDNKPPVPWGDRPWGQIQDRMLDEMGNLPPEDVQ